MSVAPLRYNRRAFFPERRMFLPDSCLSPEPALENDKKNVAVLASCQALLRGILRAEICSLALQLDMPSSAGDDRSALARPLAEIVAQPRDGFLSAP